MRFRLSRFRFKRAVGASGTSFRLSRSQYYGATQAL
jgi:hypothetical protein